MSYKLNDSGLQNMLNVDKVRHMVYQLLATPDYSASELAQTIGIRLGSLQKLQRSDDFNLMAEKQLRLIKLYCSRCVNKMATTIQ